MDKYVILSLDYELFGDGSGDIFKNIIIPTKNIVQACLRYNAKLTIFVEIIEFIKIQETWEEGNSMGYKTNPILAIKKQLQELYLQGHDIQLHIHPQWLKAIHNGSKWQVDNTRWRLGDFKTTNNIDILELIKMGKLALEEFIKPIAPDYQCIALRAGGYNIQPSAKVLKAMQELGLKYDSSVYSGGMEEGYLSRYDYSSINNEKGWWFVETDVRHDVKKKTNVIELPIVAYPIHRIKKYITIKRILSFLRYKKKTKETFQYKIKSNKIIDKIRFFTEIESLTWDFCLLSKSQHKQYLKNISQLERSLFMLIGHPKSYIEDNSLDYLLKEFKSKNYIISTIKNLHETQIIQKLC